MNGSATSEPQVPGALGKVPEPKPKAMKCHGLRHTDGGTLSGSVTVTPEMLIAPRLRRDALTMLIQQLHARAGFDAANQVDRPALRLQAGKMLGRQGKGQQVVVATAQRAVTTTCW